MTVATTAFCHVGHRSRGGRFTDAPLPPALEDRIQGRCRPGDGGDRAAEVLIRSRIREHWPTHDVLGEEQGLSDQGSEYRWYVDPLDGTTNFAHGYPVFCVSLALEYHRLEHEARRTAAVIYDPTRDELFSAEPGEERDSTARRSMSRKRRR